MSVDLRAKPFYLSGAQDARVRAALSRMSDAEKAGQLFCLMGGDHGETELEELVSRRHIGGLLFRPEPAEALRRRWDRLDALCKFPLLKAANLEEGGCGAASDGCFFGWPMGVAATGDPVDMVRLAEVCAREGMAAGINWTFSPVCDLDMNFRNPITNVRSCGADPERTAALCAAYVETVQALGLAACAKHFPGDGVDFRDQHLHPTYNTLSAPAWWASYGRVYARLVDAGVMSVMAGHILQPALEREAAPGLAFEDCRPGSLSRPLLQGVLRGRLGFNGLVATDATIMGGFTQSLPRRLAIPAAIEAGCDVLVFSPDVCEDLDYLLDGLRRGLLRRERLDEAVLRVLALKARVCGAPVPAPAKDAMAWRDACARRGVTLVKDRGGLLPLTPARWPRVRLITLGELRTPEGDMAALAEALLRQAGFAVERFDIEAERLCGVSGLGGRLNLYLANLPHASNQTAVRIAWDRKHALDAPRHVCEEPSVFVSFANPYHLQDVPRVQVYVNAYSCHASAVRAVADKLLGRSAFTGRSPVDAFCGLPDAKL